MLYTTGFVGMWDRTKDQLEMSATKCDLGEIDPRFLHRTKVLRLGSLTLIRANATGRNNCKLIIFCKVNHNISIYFCRNF